MPGFNLNNTDAPKRTDVVPAAQRSTLLTMPRLPGRLHAEEAAVLLGVKSSDIPILVTNRFLIPLGESVAQNAPY